MPEYPYTLKQIAEITGKSNTALFAFIKENGEFINQHSQKNGRFVKYDEDALQSFIKRFGQVDKTTGEADPQETAPEGAETPQTAPEVERVGEAQASVIEAFEAQIDALKRERDELATKLEARERDCAEWRTQAGQALSALSKEQERVERLEERLAGYLPAPTQAEQDPPKTINRKLSFGERLKILFGRELETK